MSTEIKIMHVKLVKGGEKLELEYKKTEADGSTTLVVETHNSEVHPDMKAAFSGLDVHLALIAELIPITRAKDKETVEPFKATSYSLGGKEDNPGVVISGTKKLKSGKAFNFNTPFQPFEQEEENAYKLVGVLEDSIKKIEGEVILYLEGKVLPDPQQDLFPEKEKQENGVPVEA